MPQDEYNPQTKIWSGPDVAEHPQCTIGQLIRQTLRRDPKKIGQICANSGVVLSNEEILLRSLKIASYLSKQLDFNHNDVVSIVARNTENVASLVFGLLHCGVSVNALDTSYGEYEVINLFKDLKPKAVFCDADKYDVVVGALKALQNQASIYIVSENTDKQVQTSIQEILNEVSTEEALEFRPNDPTDPKNHAAVIMCSSGTTGTSKGVCLPHTYFLVADSIPTFGRTGPLLCFSSLYWISGWIPLIFGTFYGMTRVITDEPFSAETMLRIIEQYNVAIVLGSPTQMALMVSHPDLEKRNLSSLKAYIFGGSAIAPKLCNEFQQKIPHCLLVVSYGSTEIGLIAKMEYSTKKVGSVGKLQCNVQLKIIDDNSVALKPNEIGEICLKVKHRFLEYYGRPHDTEITLTSDGWVHTGDLGYIDDAGFIYLVDRKKEILKYKNYQVSPSELEGALIGLEGVNLVCVCGVPDEVYTDLPAALIVKGEDANLNEEHVHSFMKATLSVHKQLRGGVYFVNSLPLTPAGKICRYKARELALKLYKETPPCCKSMESV